VPLYEYECDNHGHRFEVIQKFSDPPVAVCPTCGGPVHKVISSPAFQFKGSGWYITDYARKDSKESKESGGEKTGSDAGDSKASKDTTTSTNKDTSAKKTESTETKSST
jgi:putative FmdB family regulatory protein